MRALVVPLLMSVFVAGALFAGDAAPVDGAKSGAEKADPPQSAPAFRSSDASPASNGVAAGATLAFGQVTIEEKPDEDLEKRFILHIPIKARPDSKIDPHQLVIHVLFFDIIDRKDVVETAANVRSQWVTPPADWIHSDTEELAIEYQLPKQGKESRKYFG
jgi:hypothetical protein